MHLCNALYQSPEVFTSYLHRDYLPSKSGLTTTRGSHGSPQVAPGHAQGRNRARGTTVFLYHGAGLGIGGDDHPAVGQRRNDSPLFTLANGHVSTCDVVA